MASIVTVKYDSVALGVPAATLGARMAAAVLPQDVLVSLGLRVTSDVTVAAPPPAVTQRAIVLSFIPSVAATATPVISNTGRIESIIVTAPGLDYIIPPGVGIVDPNRRPSPPSTASHTDGLPPGGPDTSVGNKATFKAFLNVQDTTQVSGGAGYVTPTVTFLGGLPPAGKLGLVPEPAHLTLPPTGAVVTGCVRAVNIPKGQEGLGYPANTQVFFEGGGSGPGFIPAKGTVRLSPSGRILGVDITDMGAGYTSTPIVVFSSPSPVIQPAPRKIAQAFAVMARGRPARATAVVALGVITSLTITDPGSGYISPPRILIVETGGSGAIFTPRMGVERIDVICPGRGYTSTATVVITPAFKKFFPDTGDQRKPFHRLFEVLIATTALTPVYSERPLLA